MRTTLEIWFENESSKLSYTLYKSNSFLGEQCFFEFGAFAFCWELISFIMIFLTLLFGAMVEIALEPFGKEHADDEAPEPYYLDLEGEDGEEHDCGSGAETSDAPAESEAESSQHQLEVDDLVGGVEQVVAQKGVFPSLRDIYFFRSM